MKIIRYINTAKLIEEDNNYYILKPRKIEIEDIYSNLINRNFNNFLSPIEINNSYEKYEFINELNSSDDDRSNDIVYLMSLLHNKTTSFNEVNENELKTRFEEIIKILDETYEYYSNLQNIIEEEIYMSPAEQLLMNNISKIYYLLNISRKNIEDYYEIISNKKVERKSIIHGNLKMNHILESKEKYLISWNNSKKEIPVYDLVKFYKNEYEKIELSSLYENYKSKYKLNEEEENLFISLISIPNIIKLDKTNYIDCININGLVDYVDKTIAFISKQNQKD